MFAMPAPRFEPQPEREPSAVEKLMRIAKEASKYVRLKFEIRPQSRISDFGPAVSSALRSDIAREFSLHLLGKDDQGREYDDFTFTELAKMIELQP